MSTISMIHNPTNGNRTKHIEVRYNLIREQVSNRVIAVRHLSTTDMTSDILTKSLSPTPFQHLRSLILGMLLLRVFV